MEFAAEVLSGIDEIKWYSIIGTIIFISLFIGMLFYTYKIPKKNLDQYKHSIFDKQDD